MNYLIINPSDIYYLTGVRSHDVGEILLISQVQNAKYKIQNEGIVFCDPRTSAMFDREKYEIIEGREAWKMKFSEYPELATDPDALTQTLREKIEGYGVKLSFAKSPITHSRIIKTPEEIQKLQKSQEMNKMVYEKIVPEIVVGVTEEQIARRIQIIQLELGASAPSFPPIVAFGENAAIPHHSPTLRMLQDGEPVLVDMGLIYAGYCSDMTRTFLFSGTFDGKSTQNHREEINSLSSSATDSLFSGRSESISPRTPSLEKQVADHKEFLNIISLLQTVTNFIISWAKPGMRVAELDAKAREMLGEYEPYFTHSLGHGVGIDIHEEPFISVRSDAVLEPGMVITIEPGIYLAGKYGARYEEMTVVGERGLILI